MLDNDIFPGNCMILSPKLNVRARQCGTKDGRPTLLPPTKHTPIDPLYFSVLLKQELASTSTAELRWNQDLDAYRFKMKITID